MGEDVAREDTQEESVVDPRECLFELPPLERSPYADAAEQANAIRQVIGQAEQERAAAADQG